MPNYQNGKIYKIHSYQTDDIYIGSTTDTLSRRFSGHKTNAKRNLTVKSKQILEYDDAMITLIENYPCNDKYELEKRERYHIENNNCVNKHVPTRTDKEYKLANKDKIKQQRQQYDFNNRDNKHKYYEDNKDKILNRTKQYKLANKDKIKQTMKIYNKYRNSHFGIICKSYGIFD